MLEPASSIMHALRVSRLPFRERSGNFARLRLITDLCFVDYRTCSWQTLASSNLRRMTRAGEAADIEAGIRSICRSTVSTVSLALAYYVPAQELASLSWAYARLDAGEEHEANPDRVPFARSRGPSHREALLAAFADVCLRNVSCFNGPGLARVAWAFATLGRTESLSARRRSQQSAA